MCRNSPKSRGIRVNKVDWTMLCWCYILTDERGVKHPVSDSDQHSEKIEEGQDIRQLQFLIGGLKKVFLRSRNLTEMREQDFKKILGKSFWKAPSSGCRRELAVFQQQQEGHCERSAVRETVIEVCSSGMLTVHTTLGNLVIQDFGFYSMAAGKPM